MTRLSLDNLHSYRAQTYRSSSSLRLKSKEAAIEFINQRGFILFWPNRDLLLPSLWAAVAGDRPVPDDHDDPGHICWGWKDDLLGKKLCFYGRVLHHRNAFISMDILPYFYALSPNYGDPETDYLEDYRRGLMTQEAKSVYESLLREGPMDSISLRQATHLASSTSKNRFGKSLDDLQMTFRILPVGVAQVGTWNYAFIYDILPHHLTDLLDKAGSISDNAARLKLLELYLQSVGASQFRDITRIFPWDPEVILQTLAKLEQKDILLNGIQLEGAQGDWVVLSNLVT